MKIRFLSLLFAVLYAALSYAVTPPEAINVIVGMREPQTISWTPELTIWDVIKKAGTIHFSAAVRKVRLIRGADRAIIDLPSLKRGEIAHPKLQPGDTIEIPD